MYFDFRYKESGAGRGVGESVKDRDVVALVDFFLDLS